MATFPRPDHRTSWSSRWARVDRGARRPPGQVLRLEAGCAVLAARTGRALERVSLDNLRLIAWIAESLVRGAPAPEPDHAA